MATKYEEGKRYLVHFTGEAWRDHSLYDEPVEAVYEYRNGGYRFTIQRPGMSYVSEEQAAKSDLDGYAVRIEPIEEPTPTELHYLYPDGTEFSVFPDRYGEIVFVQETFDSLVSRLGAKPAPKKYEDGLYVDKDGDEVLWHNGRLWTGWETYPNEYQDLYGPLTPKEDQ